VHVDGQVGEAAHEDARPSRVVEVDVSEEQPARRPAAKAVEQRLDRRRRARVDHESLDLERADDPLAA
jgi:hypothetical protein